MKYIMITGGERSGTTMISRWLQGHSSVFVEDEYRVVETMVAAWNVLERQRHHDDIKDISLDYFRAYLEDMYRERGWGGKIPVVDKHPMMKYNIDMLKFLKKAFPKMNFIYMLRDGRNVVKSMRQRTWGGSTKGSTNNERSIEFCCELWNKVIDNTYDYIKENDNFTIFRFEDIKENTIKNSKKICDLIGIEYDNPIPFKTDRKTGKTSYKDFFDNDQIEFIEDKIGDNLKRTNYA